MRTRDVMSSPVITVAPDTHLKDVAATGTCAAGLRYRTF